MKNGNGCVKCHSNDIRKIDGKYPMSEQHNMAKISTFKRMFVTRYVCVTCGYSEEWMENTSDLNFIAKKAEKPDDVSDFV